MSTLSIALLACSLQSGLYLPVEATHDSVCPQKVRVQCGTSGAPLSLRITYEGDCAGQGPYTYACSSSDQGEITCGAGPIAVTLKDDISYFWENRGYGVRAMFRLMQ